MNMKNMRINTLLLLSVCLLIRCANNGSNTENNIVVNIKGPTNCDYTLSVHSKNLSVIGASLNYLELDSIIVPGDTTKYHFDTIMNISDLNKLSRIIDELQLEPIVDTTIAKDAYQFTLSVNAKRIIQTDNPDIKLYEVLKILRPYVNDTRILCSDFFQNLDKLEIP